MKKSYEKKKIALVTPSYFHEKSIIGGAERYVHELAKSLLKHADVDVISFNDFDDDLMIEGVRYIIFKGKKMRDNPCSILAFRHLWRLKDYDLVHCHQIFMLMTEMAVLQCRLLGKPVVLTGHGGGGLSLWPQVNILHHSDRVLNVSHYQRQLIEQTIYSRGDVVFGGVDLKKFDPAKIDESIEENYLVSFGRILPHKGFHLIIEALEDQKLVIMGRVKDLDYFEYLKKISAGKDVSFKTDCSDEELIQTVGNAQMAIFASCSTDHRGDKVLAQPELLGLAPLEAMALNTPVFVSDVGAYPEVAYDQNYVFKEGSVSALKDVMNRFKKDNTSFRGHVEKSFSWKAIGEQVYDIYLDLIK